MIHQGLVEVGKLLGGRSVKRATLRVVGMVALWWLASGCGTGPNGEQGSVSAVGEKQSASADGDVPAVDELPDLAVSDVDARELEAVVSPVDGLRPEVVPLLSEPTKAEEVVLSLYPEIYLTVDHILQTRLARVRSLHEPTELCLASAGYAGDLNRGAQVILANGFSFEGSDGRMHVAYPALTAEAATAAADVDSQVRESAIESACASQAASLSSFIFQGAWGEAMQRVQQDGDWLELEPSEQSALSEAMIVHCPSLVNESAESCDDLAGYVASVLPIHRSLVERNLMALQSAYVAP